MTGQDESPRPDETVLGSVRRLIGEQPSVRLEAQGDELKVTMPGLAPRGRGNYELQGEIARGGMGIILKGHDTDLGREVAVKVLDERMARDPNVLHRFIEEAQIGGQLQHPGVVPIYELGMMADDRPFFAMKLIRGSTLGELLAERPSPEHERPRFLSIFESICQTVAFAHSKHVIHRDLKPANVMVGAFGEVQVVDWGLAKVLVPDGEAGEAVDRDAAAPEVATVRSGPESTGLQSIDGSVFGTPAYMAPEQAKGQVELMDERTDVFSLGGILCQILTGAPPYEAGEGEHIVLLAARARLEPALARIDRCAADAELKELCRDCLRAEASERPAGAGEVALRMQTYLASLEQKAHRAELAATEARELRRRQRLVLGLVTILFLSAAAVGFAIHSTQRQRQDLRYREVATARRQLDGAAEEISRLQGGERFEEALERARAVERETRALGLDESALTDRAQRMVAMAEGRSTEARERQESLRRNSEFLERGQDLRERQIETLVLFRPSGAAAELDADYERVFRDYGIDIGSGDLSGALDALVSIEIGPEIGMVLDDWADLRRRLYGPDSIEAEAVTALALDLDQDPHRARLRVALLTRDEQALLAFLGDVDLAELHPATMFVLGMGLDALGRSEEYFAVTRAGASLHPDDFLLNARAGQAYAARGAHVVATSFLSSAVAARPESAATYALLGESLRAMGDLPRAAESYSASLLLEPDYDDMRNNLAWLRVRLGDFAAAAQLYEVLMERIPDDPVYEFKHLVVLCLLGEASTMDVLDFMEDEDAISGRDQSTAVWLLVFHPDPEQVDLERAIAIQDSWGHEEPATEATEAVALLRLGRPQAALAVLARGETLGKLSSPQHAQYALCRARATLELGDEKQARRFLAIAEATMGQFMYDGQAPWAKTQLVRMHRETTELLGD